MYGYELMNMSILSWLTKQPSRYRNEGIRRANRKNKQELMHYFLRGAAQIDSRGTAIYEQEWDVLIVLDACRVDVLSEVSPEYSFLPDKIDSKRSKASCSRLWMDRNFLPKYRDNMEKTIHITGNPYSQEHLESSWFQTLDEVWKYAWDSDLGTAPCRPITDRAISSSRTQNPDQLLIHYLQPHFPSIPKPLDSAISLETFGRGWDSVWDRLEQGDIDKRTVWESYKENLRYVLNDVEILLQNISAENVVITADHGNAFGEWDLYGHPPRTPISSLRKVPWVQISAQDSKSYKPSTEMAEDQVNETTVQTRLADLGYL
jgi:hypothetical protein